MSLQKRLSQQELAVHKNKNDVTNDLTSLNFENALSSDERQYLFVRARYHAFTVTSCAHSAYVVAMLNEMRQVLSEMRNPINKTTVKFINQTPPRDPLKVGLIGCGRLGKQIVSCLLAFSDIRAEEIVISTRRPNSLNHFQKAGIKCVFDNRLVAASTNILFICCLPAHISTVADDIAGYISANCLVYSFVTATALPRLRQILLHNNIIKLEYTWSMNNAEKPWKLGDDVVASLQNKWIAELTCPLSNKARKDSIVWVSPKAIEAAIYGALNMCPSLNVTSAEAIRLLNMVFLNKHSEDLLTWKDILDSDSLSYVESGNLPVFDLFHIGTQTTPLTTYFKSDEKVRNLLLGKYLSTFNTFNNSMNI